MKKTIIYTLILVLIGFVSCEKFLEEEFLAGDSTDRRYSTAKGMENLVSASYTTSKIWFAKEEGYDFSTAGTDIYDYGQQHPQQYQYTFTTDFNPTNSRLVVLWVELYRGVNACNDAIAVLSDPERTPFDEDKTKVRLSEVRYLRGLYNWIIYETWGEVHLTTEPVVGVVTTANRTPRDAWYKLILDDLDYSVNNLTDTDNTGNSDYGRVTRDAALAFRSRMNLTWGYHSGDNAYLSKAAEDAKAVISSSNYTLYDNYSDVWLLDNNNNNTENIWAINYSRTEYAVMNVDPESYRVYQRDGDKPWDDREGGHHGHLMFGMQYDIMQGMQRDLEGGRPFRRYNPTMYLIDAFHEDVDERFYGSFKTIWISNNTTRLKWPVGEWHNDPEDTVYYRKPIVEPGDTCIVFIKGVWPETDTLIEDEIIQNYIWHYNRDFWTLDHSHMFNADGTIRGERTNDRNLCFELSKFTDPERAAPNGAGSQRGIRDAYVIRISEMYINAAEALWKSGTNTDEAYALLTTLANARSVDGNGAAMLASYGINSGADLTLEYFLDERAREFCGEQIRWFDLKRSGKMVERMKSLAGNPEARANFSDKFVVRPIPQVQIDAIADPTYQNPGYN